MDANAAAGSHRVPRLRARAAPPRGVGGSSMSLKPIPDPRHGTQLAAGVDPRDRYKAADLHRPLRRDIVNEARLQFGPGYMAELTGAIGNRGVTLQQHEKSRPGAQSHRQIDPKLARLTGSVKTIAGLRLDETLHRRDDDVVPDKAPDIEGCGAADRARHKRIGERGAGRA